MATHSSSLDKHYPTLPTNEFSQWIDERRVYLFGTENGLTQLNSSLPPLSKLILITSDDGEDSLFFSAE